MRPAATPGAAIWLLVVLAATAAAGTVVGESVLLPIPRLDLESLGDVGAHLLEQSERLDAVLALPEPDRSRLAEAYGELGRLYLAYELWHPGEACLANAATLAPRDLRWSYYLGYLYRRSGRLERSAELFERTLELRPGYPPAVLRLGQVYLQLGRPDRIEPLLEKAGREVGEQSALRVLRGQAELAARNYEAAREQFAAVLAANPEAGWVNYQLAQAYRGLGRLDEARHHLEMQTPGSFAIADPLIQQLTELATSAGFYWRRAVAAYEAGEAEQALAEFRHALESDPTRTDIRTGLALILVEFGDLDGAREQYRRVLDQDPGELLARLGVGRVLALTGKHAAAVEEYEVVLAKHPDSTDALAARAAALAALGRHEAALADWTRLVELEPWNGKLRLARARGLLHANLPGEAVAELRAVLAADPANAPAALDLGGLYARLGRHEAAGQLAAVLALDARPAIHAAAHFNLGLLASAAGTSGPAIDHLSAATDLRPEWVEAHLRLAELLDGAGRYDEAAAIYGRAITLHPEDGSARLAQARCLTTAGRFREARERLEEGFARFPASAAFAHDLARLLAASPEDGLRDGTRALQLATAVVRADASVENAETLAMALAEVGRFDEASGLLAETIARAERAGSSEPTLQRLRGNLAEYRDGRPLRLGGASRRDR